MRGNEKVYTVSEFHNKNLLDRVPLMYFIDFLARESLFDVLKNPV